MKSSLLDAATNRFGIADIASFEPGYARLNTRVCRDRKIFEPVPKRGVSVVAKILADLVASHRSGHALA